MCKLNLKQWPSNTSAIVGNGTAQIQNQPGTMHFKFLTGSSLTTMQLLITLCACTIHVLLRNNIRVAWGHGMVTC